MMEIKVTDYLRNAHECEQPTAWRAAYVARAAGQLAQEQPGEMEWRYGEYVVILQPGGMCDRFVREVIELAAGRNPGSWHWRRPTAAMTEGALSNARRRSTSGGVGCLCFFDDGLYGHVAISIGKGLMAENTVSARGNPSRPGTKITPFHVIQAQHLTPGRWYDPY